jgi:hypothetical protein
MILKGAALSESVLKSREEIRASLKKDDLKMCTTVMGSFKVMQGDPDNDSEAEAAIAIWLEELEERIAELKL